MACQGWVVWLPRHLHDKMALDDQGWISGRQFHLALSFKPPICLPHSTSHPIIPVPSQHPPSIHRV